MSEEKLGLVGATAIALGGMIGGGIYAVLGVVTQMTGAATWAAFVVAGVVAICVGYAYNRLNALSDEGGGSVTFVQAFTGRTTLAGMAGWTLLFGYIGSMAMYAVAFAEFTLSFDAVPAAYAGVDLRPVVAVLAVAAFVGLNLLGARTSGSTENVLVGVKMLVLVVFGLGGVAYVLGASADPLALGTSSLASFDPITAAGVSFVAFQGWQLLFYDQESIENPTETIRKAVYISIPVAVAVYVLVAVATYNLAPEALASHPHVALKDAAESVAGVVGFGRLGGVLMALSALFSTGSAINATLFSSSHFAKGMLSSGLLPDQVGDADADGLPERTVVVVGALTAAFAAYGSLEAVTNFASLSFVVAFAAVSYLAVRQREHADVNPVPPLVGVAGAVGFLPLVLYHLYRTEPNTFALVFVLAVVVVGIELLYFEHDDIEREVALVEDDLETNL